MRIILASTSPRRRDILALLGLPFETIAPAFDELKSRDVPVAQEVLAFAVGKASTVARDNPESLVIGSDTMILLQELKIGKPEGVDHARRILRSLSGKTHRIFTSVAILDGMAGPGLRTVSEVRVAMRRYTDAEIEMYLLGNEWLDKAGAYSIQGEGAALIESIRGDFLAAVGLPLKPIADYLRSRNVAVPTDIDKLYAEKSFPNWSRF